MRVAASAPQASWRLPTVRPDMAKFLAVFIYKKKKKKLNATKSTDFFRFL
jgi:hypothetical protein